MKLSTAAQAALINTVGRVAAPVLHTGAATLAELRAAGLVSATGNLTRSGVSVRAELFAEMLEVEL